MPKRRRRKSSPPSSPLLVAIVGGSGAGKTWLAKKLHAALAPDAAHFSLDDFYRDRSHIPFPLHAKINFDHPRAIDWAGVEKVLRDLCKQRATHLPRYDFKTHCRRAETTPLRPKPIVLMDGLWLLRRPSMRRLFALKIFVDCPARTRKSRRLARDLRSRGWNRPAIIEQFRDTVQPMHLKFVAPQQQWADVVLRHDLGSRQVRELARELRARLDVLRSSSTENGA